MPSIVDILMINLAWFQELCFLRGIQIAQTVVRSLFEEIRFEIATNLVFSSFNRDNLPFHDTLRNMNLVASTMDELLDFIRRTHFTWVYNFYVINFDFLFFLHPSCISVFGGQQNRRGL